MGLLASLFHPMRARTAHAESARVAEMIDRVIAMNPRLRLSRHYRERLGKAVSVSLTYIDDLIGSLPAPHEANAAAWSTDPLIRVFFATPDDLVKAFSRSEELRTYFGRNSLLTEAYATLGMAMFERHVLGVASEGGEVRHDVPQTTLCFSDHRVRVCGKSDADLREEIARRLVDQLALEGLARLAADRHALVAKGRELIAARVALLERRGVGMRSVVGGSQDADSDELARLENQIAENTRNLAALRVPTELIDLQLDRVCEVFSTPAEHIYVEKRRLRLDLMNVIRNDDTEASREIELRLARIPGDPPRMRAFILVRFARDELLPAGLHVDAATRAM
ncbi:hypothetical protein OKW33_006167 [Paraburkholderia atlantica]|uniref:hypothetical protein n=2 Tax=Paraburkholderia atlantica TaxID=2654982 RepID=UPI0004768074|nr:hypothetical protein [Paraburkholderia atlantica]MPW08451.1 hypothetical protein [Paraburkholderia atlantica]NUY35301.1 hypothetical protein [Paraburkholderia atlantica]